jgi:hypothetical protein
MTTEENPLDNDTVKLFGAVMGQMQRDAQWNADQLLAIREQEVGEWKAAFAKLYAAMEKVAHRTDSATAYGALDRFFHLNTDAVKNTKNSLHGEFDTDADYR